MKIFEYREKILEYRVKIFEYRVKIFEYRVKIFEYRVDLENKQHTLIRGACPIHVRPMKVNVEFSVTFCSAQNEESISLFIIH